MNNRKIIGKERITREVIEREINSEFDDSFHNIVIPKKHSLNNGNFITIFQDVMKELSKAELTKNELRMLFFLIGSAGQGNVINIELNELCNELNEYKSNVSRTIGSLVKKNIIIKAVKKGALSKGESNIYELSLNYDRLNYQLAYKGKVKDYKHLQHKDPKILKALPQNDSSQLTISFENDSKKTESEWKEFAKEFKDK
jgi:predicted transcriptional regulator